ncbi:MAG TPA: TetR/AcrR family transcriptional regulator [Arenibaculum sp.]|nr:TetR/AcrR family transcriptional regulator [Arenibaculum sp.]
MEARILEAAERVFAEAGFGGASMSQIAAAAGLSKANLHYYVGTKQALYRGVLTGILDLWLDAAEALRHDREPAAALAAFVRTKMAWSRSRPHASRVFANELLHGAPFVRDYLATELRRRVDDKSRVLEAWIADGRMAPVDPRHLFFMLWATTQTYADFAVQVHAVMGVEELSDEQFEHATVEVIGLVLRGCGIAPETRHETAQSD